MTTQASPDMSENLFHRVQQSADVWLLLAFSVLLGLGLVMVASASVSVADKLTGDSMYYFKRQLFYAMLGITSMLVLYRMPLDNWHRSSSVLMLFILITLVLVLVPGIGKSVNGSSRWLALGPINLQVSEFAKLLIVIYLSSYLVRCRQAVSETVSGFLKPVLILGVTCLLLLLEPDLGASVVVTATALSLLFLSRVGLWKFGILLGISAGAIFILAISSAYRLERIYAFLDPWADPFNSGFQLTQSLIAIGSGSWWGAGLGASVQKLFYLPEAHTDFLFAVMAEELGLAGVAVVIALFAVLVYRCFVIGSRADEQGMPFAAYLAYGIGTWMGIQAFINMGVNMGMLPTKGLTLPLMSSGGSSLLVVCAAMGLVFRVHREISDSANPATRISAYTKGRRKT